MSPKPSHPRTLERSRRSSGLARRVFDITGSLVAMVALAPLFAVVSALVFLEDGGPVFFRQERVGMGGRRFYILKFRTMMREAAQHGKPITVAGDQRITHVGAVLRRLKLDEFAQLVNVLKGDMSFCGPRPEVPCYVNLGSPIWQAILTQRPGITDPASVVYRHEEQLLAQAPDPERLYTESVLPEKLRISLRYLQSRSLISDLKLIFLTARYSFLPSSPDRRLIERVLQ
jgi:lipopolysaccharide/colanic/teichoic acid biosynthesis glycosyltransferase